MLKKYKQLICGIVIGGLIFGSIPIFAQTQNIEAFFNNIKVKINGRKIRTDTEPLVYNGRTYIPLRAIGDALGMNVGWDEPNAVASLDSNDVNTEYGKTTIQNLDFVTDEDDMYVNLAEQIKRNVKVNSAKNSIKEFSKYTLPTAWTWKEAPIQLYFDKDRTFYTDFDVANFKNTGGKTYYVNPTSGSDTDNNGLAEATPFKSIKKAYDMAADNDTIMLADGFYSKTNVMNGASVTKSLNFIAKNPGKVICSTSEEVSYTKTEGKNNVYQANVTNVTSVIDVKESYPGQKYKKVASVNECEKLEGSWYMDDTKLFVHTLTDSLPDNKQILALQGEALFDCGTANKNINVYFEGMVLVGGSYGSLRIRNSAKYKEINGYAKNCEFYHAMNSNAVEVVGATNAFFQNCKAAYGEKDGFNYHAQNDVAPKVIEVDCIGYNNGANTVTFDNNNGSTIHDGGKIIRINGIYYGNTGANVSDAHADTQSLNIGVISFESKSSTTDNFRCNFSAQQAGVTMWLDSCISLGSVNDFHCVANCTLYVKNSKYHTLIGTGNFIFE